MNSDTKIEGIGQKFGGDWTNRKLSVLENYLNAYLKVLKNTKFKIAYIDAFAGSGYIESKKIKQGSIDPDSFLIVPDNISDFKELHQGSARMALDLMPHFDKYIYIDKNSKNCERLHELKAKFPDHDIDIFKCDANDKIKSLCNKKWDSHRAVLFLDPFGMQVDWETIKSIASTKAIDLWILLPVGIVNRLLQKNGDITESRKRNLNRFFGTEDWLKEFYSFQKHATLFSDDVEIKTKKATPEIITQFYNHRLNEIFEGVIEVPGVLKNSKNSPMFYLCFAVGNKNGKNIALNIASQCLSKLNAN